MATLMTSADRILFVQARVRGGLKRSVKTVADHLDSTAR